MKPEALLRYVPPGAASLAADAPGYHDQQGQGPLCWKCRGSGAPCKVCGGAGRLPARNAVAAPGKITRGRRGALAEALPPPAGYRVAHYGALVQKATTERVDVEIEIDSEQEDDDDALHSNTNTITDETQTQRPTWLPGTGQELCNLVGRWRLLQRSQSHRWTTDDLVTAAVAARYLQLGKSHTYCDLGTGNASVLHMVLHQALLCNGSSLDCAVGVEARAEAVQLARRSLDFNIGVGNARQAQIVHADFRTWETSQTFDLVTGTPPYFRVDFGVADGGTVDRATIRQGGMPTALQSAPARCEFRGGIEAYCQAAARLLSPDGIFVVCENCLNHERALTALARHGLYLVKCVRVHGRAGKGPLFGVYVATRRSPQSTVETVDLVVRDEHGEWTEQYKRQILDFMAIPYE